MCLTSFRFGALCIIHLMLLSSTPLPSSCPEQALPRAGSGSASRAFSLASSKVPLWLTHILRPLGVWTFTSHRPNTGRSSKMMFIPPFLSFWFFKNSRIRSTHCFSFAILCVALRCSSVAVRSDALPLPRSSSPGKSSRLDSVATHRFALQFNAQPFHYQSTRSYSSPFHCCSAPVLAKPCHSFAFLLSSERRHAVAYSTSSQVNLPLPELRH